MSATKTWRETAEFVRERLCAGLPSVTTLEWIDQQHFAKTKMAYTFLPSDLNAITVIKSYYCVILKMVILHDAIKTIQNSVFVFFPKKKKSLFFFKKSENPDKKTKHVNCFFNPGFFNTDYFSTFFCDFPLIARSGTSHVTISLIGCASYTESIGPCYWGSCELLAFEYVKISIDNKTSFVKFNPCSMSALNLDGGGPGAQAWWEASQNL